MKLNYKLAFLLLPVLLAACSDVPRQLNDGSFTFCEAGAPCQQEVGGAVSNHK